MLFEGNMLHLSALLQAVEAGKASSWNEWRERNPDIIIDLRGADLSNRDLSQYNFHNTDLRFANLSRTCLFEADLSYAELNGSDLTEADLRKANLYKTNLSEANLDRSSLTASDIINAILRKTSLCEVSFSH